MNDKTSKKKALFIGAACVDVVIYLERLPKTEEDLHPHKQDFALGGCAGNAARAARLLSDSIELASPVGTGVFGELAEKFLRKAQIPVRIRVPEENGCCYCFVEDGGERTFLSVHGAEYTFHREWMSPFDHENIEYVYVSGLEVEEPTGHALLRYLAEYPQRNIVYCPGTRGIGIPDKNRELFSLRPILHLNAKEAEAIAKSLAGEAPEKMPDERIATLTASLPDHAGISRETLGSAAYLQTFTENAVIVTLGEKGAYCLPRDGAGFFVPAVKTKVVNTIGAGDTHAGAFIASLLNGKDLKESLQAANALAARTVAIEAAVPDQAEVPYSAAAMTSAKSITRSS